MRFCFLRAYIHLVTPIDERASSIRSFQRKQGCPPRSCDLTPLGYYLVTPIDERDSSIRSFQRLQGCPPRNCDLTPLDYYLWGAVKDKCYADKPETIDALKENIRQAIGETQLYTIDNMLKNLTDRVGRLLHGQPRQPFEWYYFSIINRMHCTFNKKKKFEKIFRSFF